MSGTDSASSTAHRVRPISLWLYIIGAVALGVSALLGGIMLIIDPTGGALSLPLSYLAGSPFRDYLVPGIILFGVFGIGSGVVLYGVLRWRPWAWVGAVGLGLGQIVWIAVEMWIIGELHPLHIIYGGLGLALVGLALLPSAREALG